MPGIEVLARRSGVPKDSIKDVFAAISSMVEEGDKVQIRDFGTFKPAIKAAGTMSSPVLAASGGTAVIAARRVMKFGMADGLRKRWIFGDDKEYKKALKALEGKKSAKDDDDGDAEKAKPAAGKGGGKAAGKGDAKSAEGEGKGAEAKGEAPAKAKGRGAKA